VAHALPGVVGFSTTSFVLYEETLNAIHDEL
jgi:hypothetical protein